MFYLRLSNNSDPSSEHIFRFIQRTITIGKDSSNNLRLSSSDGSVSQIHAEIYKDTGNFFIVDRGSSSGTHIENLTLIRNRSYLLKEGTKISVGKYILTFLLNFPDDEFGNLEKMSVNNSIYYLKKTLTDLYNIKQNNPDICDQNTREKLKKILDTNKNKHLRFLLSDTEATYMSDSAKDQNNDFQKSNFIVDMFLKLFIEFHSMSGRISKEFIDSHTVHRRDSQQLVMPDSLKNYILNTELSSHEKEKRIKFLWNEIEDLIIKHIALFAGFKNSIKYGTRDLLKELDPVSIINSEQRKTGHQKSTKMINKYFPFVMEHRNIKTIIEKYKVLSKNVDEEIESKYYQPAFKSGYLQKVNSAHESDFDLNH